TPRCALRGKGGAEAGQAISVDGGTQRSHERDVIMEVVNRVESRAQDFVDFLQVMETGPRKMTARVAGARVVERPGIGAMHRIADADVAESREEMPVARIARRQHAIAH